MVRVLPVSRCLDIFDDLRDECSSDARRSDGSYTSEVCFTSFGNERVAELDRFQAGDEVKVSFNLRAREFNGRWYNDVRVWRISPVNQVQTAAPEPAPQVTYGAMPEQAPAPSIDDMPAEEGFNDLPF